MIATKTTFGAVPVGAKCKLENCYGVKTEPIVSRQARDFYAGKTPGYPASSLFFDWNFRYQFMGHGEFSVMSLSPETEVEIIAPEEC